MPNQFKIRIEPFGIKDHLQRILISNIDLAVLTDDFGHLTAISGKSKVKNCYDICLDVILKSNSQVWIEGASVVRSTSASFAQPYF